MDVVVVEDDADEGDTVSSDPMQEMEFKSTRIGSELQMPKKRYFA